MRTRVIVGLVTALLTGVSAVSAAAARPYTIWRVAGSSAPCATPPICGARHPATSAQLTFPDALAVSASGDVYIADWGENQVRKLSPDGRIRVVAGDGTACETAPRCGDGGPARGAEFNSPAGVAVDRAGNVYVADWGNNEVRKVSPKGKITRFAGTGRRCSRPPKCGDGGPAISAKLNGPAGLAVDRSGNLYIADSGDHEVRKVSSSGQITRVAGKGRWCPKRPACGDNGSARAARLSFPEGVALDRAGNLYIADSSDHEIRKVTPQGTITTIAGKGSPCSAPPACGDGGPATSGQLNFPDGVSVGRGGKVFIADAADNEIREISRGLIFRVAGTGAACSKPPACGDNRHAQTAALSYPDAVVTDRRGSLFVADTADNEVRWLSTVRPARISTPHGRVALAALSALVSPGSVAVRYVLGGRGRVTLSVHYHRRSIRVSSARGFPGFGELFWNRTIHGRRIRSGRYKLTVRARLGGHQGKSSVHARL